MATRFTVSGTICKEVNGGVQVQLKQQNNATHEFGWTGPFVSGHMDLNTTHIVEYASMAHQTLYTTDWDRG